MGTESRRVRRLAAPPVTTIDNLPDELLELVLLRVRTPVCLFRAAAACKHWRRVVSGAGFLPRFRSLHGGRHLLLGHYSVDIGTDDDDDEPGSGGRETSFVPWPPRAATNLRRRVSLDFLPRPHHPYTDLMLADSRGGLLAVVRDIWNVLVCHPWTGQYRELHPPWALPGPGPEDRYCESSLLGAFLLDADADGGCGGVPLMSDFRVVWACVVNDKYHDRITAQAHVFSARDGRWLPSPSPNTEVGDVHWSGSWRRLEMERFVGRAGGSIFWSGYHGRGHLLQLDESTREFSTLTLPMAPDERTRYPLYYDRETLRVVAAGAGAIRVIGMVVDVDAGELKLEVFTRANGAAECVVERRAILWQLASTKVVRPYSGYFVDTAAAAEDQLALVAFSSAGDTMFFSLDGETLKLERVNEWTYFHSKRLLIPYELPWPHNISTRL